jgi:starch-binding outer membrane protein, SusD/RagB family
MKRSQIIITILIILLLTNCEDFLNVRPEATVPSAGMDYSKAENIFLPVSASYADLRNGGAHDFSYIGAFEITSDNADKGSTPEDNPPMKEMDDLKYQSTNGLINELWNGYYKIASGANHAIQQMPLFISALQNAADRQYAVSCQGEAKTIRAYAYFNLTRLFGRVPIVDTILTAEQLASIPQSSTPELYSLIEKLLKEAIEVLPESYTKEWAGRITKYTAMAIKARVHLYQAEWDSVASLTDRIIASGRYGLLDNFREVFSIDGENSRESLFELQSSTLGKTTGDQTYMEYAFVQGPRGNSPGGMQGWGFCTPSQDLINFFNARGEVIRPATTLLYRGTKTPEGDSIKTICSNPAYNGKVYTPLAYNLWNFNGYGFDHNVRILRYSDVLLMYAEAKVRGASISTLSGLSADDAVNLVRTRAGLSELSGVTLQQIWDERRAELALEEDRFFDLIRTNQAATVLAGKGFTAGKHEVFPIPAAQLQLNPNLTQNNGYN